MDLEVWRQLLPLLRQRLSAEQYSMWIQPLHVQCDRGVVQLFAPNRFVLDWVREKYHQLLLDCLNEVTDGEVSLSFEFKLANTSIAGAEASSQTLSVDNPENNQVMGSPRVMIGRDTPNQYKASVFKGGSDSSEHAGDRDCGIQTKLGGSSSSQVGGSVKGSSSRGIGVGSSSSVPVFKHNLKRQYVFDNFVEGKSNQLARAAATQVAENPGDAYNPLFLYGGTGLGKTHLLHAVGNGIIANKPSAKVVYMHSERFVQDMVKALQQNSIDSFKRYYRSVDALLIDDIQFFAKKDRSQEEFFHTFNALLEGNQQIILTSDRYPKEIDGVEDRLKSRFGWGLTVIIEPPELETRVAILNRKAMENGIDLPSEVAFFIAKRLRSNVRELEGALNRVIANSKFTRRSINIEFVRDALGDLLALQDKLITISNIQKMVADYYRIKVSDLLSKSRSRKVARPRQLAMALAKELTNNSFPEIGNQFGGRDHTTVLHACRKIEELKRDDHDIKEDYKNLLRTLSS